jgi:hypothetical protein
MGSAADVGELTLLDDRFRGGKSILGGSPMRKTIFTCSATIRMGRRTASPENVTQQATLASSSLLPLPHALGGDS